MKQITKPTVGKILLAVFLTALFFYGCGSDSGSDSSDSSPFNDTSNKSDDDTGNKSDDDTDDDRDDDTDDDSGSSSGSGSGFSGSYQFYSEFTGCLWEYINFRATIEQAGYQTVLSINGQDLTCQLSGNELNCSGTILDEGDRFDLRDFTLWRATDGGLEGTADYTFTNQSGDGCRGEMEMTTTLPDVGSIQIINQTNATFPYLGFSECGANQFRRFTLSSPIAPDTLRYISGMPTGCYDVAVCDNEDPNAGGCGIARDVQVRAAQTESLPFREGSSLMRFAMDKSTQFEHFSDPDEELNFEESNNGEDIFSLEDITTLF